MRYIIPYIISNLIKLNWVSCINTKVELSIKVKINDTLDNHNANSCYYNDIYYKTTSECGIDISLKDRRNGFVDNNMTLYEENCKLIDYNYKKEKAKFSCDIKINITKNYKVKFNKKEFFKNFIDINNIANINVMKCYMIVLKIKSLIKNYGSYIISSIILLYLLTLLIFCCYSYNKLNKNINNMISTLKKLKK